MQNGVVKQRHYAGRPFFVSSHSHTSLYRSLSAIPLRPLSAPHPLARSVNASYLLNEGSGPKVWDIARRNSGSLIGGATWGTDARGTCLSLDGSTGYMVAPHSVSLLNPFSVAGSVTFLSSASYARVFDIQRDGYSAQLLWDAGGSNLWAIKHTWWQSGFQATQWGATPSLGTTYRFAATFDPVNNIMRLWLNGKLMTGSANNNVGASFQANKLWVGVRADLNPITFGKVKVGDITVFNRELNATEIQWLFRDPFTTVLAPPARRWLTAQGPVRTRRMIFDCGRAGSRGSA